MSYNVALIDFVQFSRWCVFYSIIEYALANWLMRVEKRIEAAAAKVAKQEEAPEKAAEGSADVPPGTLVELGEVQVNGDAAPATEPPTGLRRRSRRGGRATGEQWRGADEILPNTIQFVAVQNVQIWKDNMNT